MNCTLFAVLMFEPAACGVFAPARVTTAYPSTESMAMALGADPAGNVTGVGGPAGGKEFPFTSVGGFVPP